MSEGLIVAPDVVYSPIVLGVALSKLATKMESPWAVPETSATVDDASSSTIIKWANRERHPSLRRRCQCKEPVREDAVRHGAAHRETRSDG